MHDELMLGKVTNRIRTGVNPELDRARAFA